jgi:hypothetical protein
MITGLFYFIFMIIGVNFFKGKFYYCDYSYPKTNFKNFNSADLETKWDCLNSGGFWVKYDSSFDNIWSSY